MNDASRHDRPVLRAAGLWIVGHAVLWALISLPLVISCWGGELGFCMLAAGLIALGIGGLQFVYGVIAGLVIRDRQPATSQGILIGAALVTLLSGLPCLGVYATAMLT